MVTGRRGAGYDQDGGVFRHGFFFEQTECADVVTLLEQDLSGGGQPGSLPIVETRFPVPFEKEHTFLAVLRDANQRPCQFHFRGSVDPDAVPGAFEHSRIGSCNTVVLGDFRLPFRVDELHGNLRAGLTITIEPFLIGLVAGILFSGEDGDKHLARKTPQHTIRLWSEGEVLILRQIPTNGMARGQKIDNDENADEEEDHQQTVGPCSRRAASGEGFQAAEMDDEKNNEAEEGRSFQKGNQPNILRDDAIADRSGHSQNRADHAKGNCLEIHFHRAESTTR